MYVRGILTVVFYSAQRDHATHPAAPLLINLEKVIVLLVTMLV